jgi:hypothetical protein
MKPVETLPFADALQIIDSFPDTPVCTFATVPVFADAPSQSTEDGRRRRRTVKWTPEEQSFLVNGMCRFGRVWTEILKEYPFHPQRIHTDLRDKWDNIQTHSTDEGCRRLFDAIQSCTEYRERFLGDPNATGTSGASTEQLPVLQRISDLVHHRCPDEAPDLRIAPDAFGFPL